MIVAGLDLAELSLNSRVLNRKAANLSQRSSSLVVALGTDKVAGRLGEEDHASEEDKRPGKLHSNGDTVAAGVIAAARRVVHNSGQKEANCDGELVGTDNGTTNPLGGSLRLVERDCG